MDRANVQRPMSTTSPTSRLPHVLLVATLAASISLAACGGNTIEVTADGTTTLTTEPVPADGTGAYGLVTASPTCPVQRVDDPCPPRPVDAEIEARDTNGLTKATTHTDDTGHYTLRLDPGRYTLVALTDKVLPTCPQMTVTVTARATTRVDINCDTGIR